MSLQFGFVILWQKAFGAKAALKMLVKLTPDGSDSIRLVVVILLLVCLAIGKFMRDFQFCQLYYVIFPS
jgi:hypothetical protein